MSETLKPDAQFEELNIASPLEQADNANANELSHELPVEETENEVPAANDGESDNNC